MPRKTLVFANVYNGLWYIIGFLPMFFPALGGCCVLFGNDVHKAIIKQSVPTIDRHLAWKNAPEAKRGCAPGHPGGYE
jgi:hypothetical protein